jgi:hypothetical protein
MMVQVPRIKLWRVPYSQLLILFWNVGFCNKNQIRKQRERKKSREREKRRKRNLT